MDSLLSLIPFLEKHRRTRSLPDFLEVENVLSFFCSLLQNKARFLLFQQRTERKFSVFLFSPKNKERAIIT